MELGAYCDSALTPHQTGKTYRRQAKTPNRTREIWPYGIIGGSGNVTMVKLCSCLAIERARPVALHLPLASPEFYPNQFGIDGIAIGIIPSGALQR